jgi:pimeloyl-ACP methyl ester carboxylesterase
MGARTALDVAAERPDLVDRLVLEDPPLWPGAPWEELRARDPLCDPAFTDVRRAITLPQSERAAWVKTVTPGWTPTDRRAWVVALGNLSVEVFHPGAFVYSRGWRDTLRDLRAPTLLLRGEHGLVSERVAVEAAALLPPGSGVVTITGARHSPRRERPEETFREIALFLSS